MTTKTLSILVLNYNGKDLLARYLPSVVNAACFAGASHDVIVVDNASTDDSVSFVTKNFPMVRTRVMPVNRHLFSYNAAVAECESDYVILLNNDVHVEPDFVAPLIRHFDDPRVFAVMPRVLSNKPEEQFVFRCPGRFEFGVMGTGRDERMTGPGYTLFAHGGAAAFDRKKFLSLGGLDNLYWTAYYEDIDLSYRAWMNDWLILFDPASEVFHFGHATVDKRYSPGKKRLQREKVQTLFVLKNIADPKLLANFLFWSALRLGKALVTADQPRLGAYLKTVLLLSRVWRARRLVQRDRLVPDRLILRRLRSNSVGS